MNINKELLIVNEEKGVFKYTGNCFKLNNEILNILQEKANKTELKRSRILLHNDNSSNAQQMVICISKNSSIPMHVHEEATESIILLDGHLEYVYKENGEYENVFLDALENTCLITTKRGIPHTLRSISEFSTFFECSDGPFGGSMQVYKG